MGHKPTRKRQRVYLHLAGCLTVGILFMGCATGVFGPRDQDPSVMAARHIVQGKCRLQSGDFEAARQECDTILTQYPGRLDDQAFYLMGMVLVHPDNPRQDLHKAAACFRGIVAHYPDSALVAASQTWLALISQLDESQRMVERLETTAADLKKHVKAGQDQRRRLEKRLQQMKAIDLTVE